MKNRISSAFFLVILLLLGALGALYYVKAEWNPPTLSLTPEQATASTKTMFTITASDRDSALRSLLVVATQGSNSIEILNKALPAGTKELREEFSLPKAGIKNEPLTLTITVKDTSWHRLGRGNRAQIVRQMDIDSKPPVISVLSGQHNVNHGGTGLVVYSTNEELAQSGVKLGDHFFPGYPYKPGKYLCFFALPYNVDPKAVTPILVAGDLAGNESTIGFNFRPLIKKRKLSL